MQNTLANRCQTRINGGCEVEFNPHHKGARVHTRVLRAEKARDPASHSLVLGTGHTTLGVCSNQDYVGWRQGRSMGLTSFAGFGVVRYYTSHWLCYAVPSSGTGDLGCSLRIPDTSESTVPKRFLWPLQQAFLGFRRENGAAEISQRPVIEAEPTAGLRPP